MSFPILLVHGADSLAALHQALEAQGHVVVDAPDEPGAIAHLRSSRPSLVLTDLTLPTGDGLGVLRAARELDPELQVVVMAADGSVQDAVTAMKGGAIDFLAKPVDPDRLTLLVERAIAQRRALADYIRLKEELAERRGAPRIIGEDPQLQQTSQHSVPRGRHRRHRAARRGERHRQGTVRARTARAQPSGRRALCRHQLCGHSRRAAGIGVVWSREGRLHRGRREEIRAVRDGAPGNALLDEIGDLPLGLQAKILRALEEKQFERLGGTGTLQVDSRVVAATNRNLKARVAERQFREDLYFRLSVFPITIPPLRERSGDALMLARHFVDRFCHDLDKKTLRLSPAAIDALEAHAWPGNVRELQNCIERAVILCDDDAIQPRHLSLFPGGPTGPGRRDDVENGQASVKPVTASPLTRVDLSGTMTAAVRRVTAVVERLKLEEALKDARGNKERAAEALHISYKALLQKQRQHGISE